MIQQRRAPRFSDKAVWRYLLRYSYRKRPLFLIVAVALFQPLILVPVAFFVKRIFDTLPQTRQTALFILYGTAMILLNVLSFAALHWIRRAALSVTKPINTELRGELLARMYTLPRSFHDKSSHGNLHSLIVIDTERVDAMSNAVVAQMLPAAVGGLALGTTLSYLSWRLFVIVIASAPIVLVFHRLALGRLRARFKTFRQSFEHFSTDVLFAIRAVDLTRLHSAEKQELERQKQGLEELRLAGEAQAMADTTYSLGQSWLLTANVAVILVAGGVMVGHRALSLGNLLAFYVTSGLLLNSLKPALFAVPQITAGFESLQRVEELLGRTEVEPYQGTTRLEMLGEVQFEAVEFSYGKTPLLERVDFTVRPHAIVAIAGPNGSGKTTLMHLICGLYRPVRGRIFMDGRDYETLSMQFLRQQIGVVPQDPLLFRGTIAENIGYGSGTLSRSEILDAAHLAALDGFIRKMPLGLDNPIGEDGIMLSGGQRQRIGLARALARRPRLLILDEPTNHLDGAAVLELLASIRELSPRPTVLMISHDPRALNWAEQVITIPNVVLASEVPTSAVVGCSI